MYNENWGNMRATTKHAFPNFWSSGSNSSCMVDFSR